MTIPTLAALGQQIAVLRPVTDCGRLLALSGGTLLVEGLRERARLGDVLQIDCAAAPLMAEVVAIDGAGVHALPERNAQGCAVGQTVRLIGPRRIAPDEGWLGRVIDPWGRPLDGRPLLSGVAPRALDRAPPPAATRRTLGPRLATGLAVFDTALPLVRGQRIGLFAGSGVGKSRLMGLLAQGVSADVRVIALIGERGRELGMFLRDTLGEDALARSVVIAATSDQSPLLRANCLPAAMCVAEYFRDQGQNVLLMADSITRHAEAYREIALAGGEGANLRGFPASMAPALMRLAERAGPGPAGLGDITAILTVLVAGSDMEEPVADLMRGTLDGHVVLDRATAERGRYPAVDLLRSVSRSLPDAANSAENAMIADIRAALGLYRQAEPMVRAGLHQNGADPALDRAIALWSKLDGFLAEPSPHGPTQAFKRLAAVLAGKG